MSYIFNALENYLILFLPYLLLETGFCIFYRQKGIRLTWGFLIGWQLLACLMTAVFSITGAGGIDDIGRHADSLIRLEEINLIPLRWGLNSPFGLIMNIILFVPLGIALPVLWKSSQSLKRTVMAGFLFSLLIETSQLFNWRATDIDDLLMNTLGTAAGYGIFTLCFRKLTIFQMHMQKEEGFSLKYTGLCTILLIFLFYFFLGSPLLCYVWNTIYGIL